MTIKEFLQAGGQIDPKFQLINKCEDSYTKDVRTGDKLHAEVYGQKLVLTKADNDHKKPDSTGNCNT